MRISKYFELGKTQAELDFIDIDPNKDTALFIDPHFLANRNDNWSQSATRTIRSFFQHMITLLTSNDINAAKHLFEHLKEPNETCLGLSRANPQGRGVGPDDTEKMFESLIESKAIQSGLVEDLEDCSIFVRGIGPDKLSDMATNIIKKHLIDYTQEQCRLWNIEMTPNIQTGYFWNRATTSWENIHADMLVVTGRRLLLVPKGLVSYNDQYTPQKYHQHFVLNFLQADHLRLQTALVKRRARKDGSVREYVTKEDLKEKVSPGDKSDLETFTQAHPEIFRKFKTAKKTPGASLPDDEFIRMNWDEVIDHLISSLRALPPGTERAAEYHNLVLGILELVFYPDLICPQKELPIHQGRKRIDIVFDNAANDGIFFELHRLHNVPCQFIFVECKNYSADVANAELDQLAGRFSPNRGKVGLLVCRSIADIARFEQRCADTYSDQQGLILPIVDDDLIYALEEKRNGESSPLTERLRDRRRRIQV